jgi:hypothetical protein
MVMKLNVFVIHVEAFAFRKQTCEKLKDILSNDARFDANFQYITEFDPTAITQDDIRKYVNYDAIKAEDPLSAFNPFMRNLHVNQLSNALKHFKAIQLAASSDDGTLSIIIEDDIVYNENIADSLFNALTNVPTEYDLMFLGLPSSRDVENNATYQKVSDVFQLIPACDSYHITKGAAQKMAEMYAPIKFANNIQLTYAIIKNSMRAFLAVPNVFIDGSKLGLYFSSLEVNNRLIFNQEYVKLARMVSEKAEFSEEDVEAINAEFRNVKLKTNPEFYYLKAIYETKRHNFEYAKAIYAYAFDIYENNGGLINNQSTFLRDYMRVFKDLQVV